MGTRPLTTWEQKERDGLLALETEEWREKRLIAEDPNTTADWLEKMTYFYNQSNDGWSAVEYNKYALLAEALIAHPNTPPGCCGFLIHVELLHSYRAFCCNPVVPFIVLEQPDFWDGGNPVAFQQLLREETLPPSVVQIFSRDEDEAVVESALLHIARAGEVLSREEGVAAVRASAFIHYAADYSPPFHLKYLRAQGLSYEWMDRLHTALHLPMTTQAIPETMGEPWNRSPLDLMNHLTHDGNRLVRWATQTRLTDPDFMFTWDEQ